jgi:hypothetical protein
MRGLKSHIETLTGSAPPTCPWRVFYDPLVGEVTRFVTTSREHAAVLVGDDPGLMWDAVPTYIGARNATQAHDQIEERKRREAEAKARANQRGSRG